MKYFMLFIFGATVIVINAQSLSPRVIASSGAYSSNGTNSLSYTVGEMTMVQTFSSGGSILTQGFQQPNEGATAIKMVQANGSDLVIYPNPSADVLWFAFQSTFSGKLSITINNLLGQNIPLGFESAFDAGSVVNNLNVSNLAAGTYFLTATITEDGSTSAKYITKKFEVVR
jgi:hypothetical protein